MTPVFKVSLFGDPRIEACLPAPRGLSQVTTSFIGSWCLGIHRSHLVACYFYKDARVHCVVLKMRAGPGSSPALPGQTLVRVEEGCKQPTLQDPTACLGQVTEVNVPLLLAQVVLDELRFPSFRSMFHIPVPCRHGDVCSVNRQLDRQAMPCDLMAP